MASTGLPLQRAALFISLSFDGAFMKVINLNKFKLINKVQLDNEIYDVRGRTVNEFLNDDLSKRIDEATSDRERIVIMLDELANLSTIPIDVLKRQPISVLHALIQVSQGADLGAEEVQGVDEGKK